MENRSGIYPSGDRVLVKPDPIEETTKGGIVIASTIAEKHFLAQTSGVLVATGVDCWSDYKEPFAQIDDRVMFAKYGGLDVVGKDGEHYRILNDTDITARIDEGVTFDGIEARKRMGQ